MERNLALALVKAWVPRRRAFWLGERLVPFSVFDVALLTGMPATGERVSFEEEHVTMEIGELVRERECMSLSNRNCEEERDVADRGRIECIRISLLQWCTYVSVMPGRSTWNYGRRCMHGLS